MHSKFPTRMFAGFLVPIFAAAFGTLAGSAAAQTETLPPGFHDSIVLSGLIRPTVVRFSPDGRIFVAEKSGVIKVFSSLTATTPTIFADLTTNVDNYWDRGLLGMALDPNFPTSPYVYVLYAYDAPIGGTAPVWNDACPTPPGPNTDGCVVSGRLSRLTANGSVMSGSEKVLINAWGQQFPSHSLGALQFGADGALYASDGDGASMGTVDYGQFGGNPLGDPPGGVGGTMEPPTAEGGALRSQSLRRQPGEPAVLNGTVIRVDPATGSGLSTNPLASSADANARRIVVEGLRQPFRFTIQPNTNKLWIGDVGNEVWEEIDVAPSPTTEVKNFGWPCYEGPDQEPDWVSAQVDICMNDLYKNPSVVTAPFLGYRHTDSVVSGDGCATGGSSITGLAFYGGGSYPSTYDGALFFADHTRNCAWVLFPGSGGQPNASSRALFIGGASHPVDLEIGPGGDLFYVDHEGGAIHRIQYMTPAAVATATPESGAPPLTVQFDGSGSHGAAAGDTLTYAWDLNGDGVFNDSTAVSPAKTYSTAGQYTVRLKVTDEHGVSGVSDPLTVTVAQGAPSPVIDTPSSSLTWKVGDPISFSGHATDPQDGTIPASALTWTLVMHHCPSNCHTHEIQSFAGVSSGSFSAPDHGYPSFLELQLTATDSLGLTGTTSVILQPQTVVLHFAASPSGLQLDAGDGGVTTPFSKTVIVGSTNTISAASPESLNASAYWFDGWSDGGAQTHSIVAGAASATYTATYISQGDVMAPTTATIEGRSPYPATTTEPNGVLEGGETSAFSPSWKNTSDGVVAGTTGTITSFTGPTTGGATYTIVDGNASYGDIAAGATASAGGGYQLLVKTTSRPAAHWDAVASEALNTSEAHDWTIHIGRSFTDVPTSNIYYSDVETIFHRSITVGTGYRTYSPDDDTTRGQMSAFISRGHTGGDQNVPVSGTVPGLGTYDCQSGGHSLFSDVAPTAEFCANIHWVAAHGLAYGCTDAAQYTSTFCPGTNILRRSMAVMLARDLAGGDSSVPAKLADPGNGRGYDCTDGGANAFTDVPDSDTGCRYIYFIWSKNIVDGYGNGLYGPGDAVTRGEMSKFLTNTYGLTLQ
ncbi:MAG TPA: PQQ-dependent sugar dehydrogenase [Thermoanaerobaculia bacterium]|nr:PQQ-dependent sugar dehydrogenase [Thermoanaerobaculia bacterium]